MTEEEKELVRQWARNWEALGPELERIRRHELASKPVEANFSLLDSLMDIAKVDPRVRTESGLAELQDLFMAYARQKAQAVE